MNEGKHLSKCNCPCGCFLQSYAEFCLSCETAHKYKIASYVYQREQEKKANDDRGINYE